MKRITFNDELHEYRIIDDDGTWEIPVSVTEIVAVVTGKDFSAVKADILAEARDRGIKIHQDVADLKGETPEGRWIIDQRAPGKAEREIMGHFIHPDFPDISVAGTTDLLFEDALEDIKSQGDRDILGWTIQLNLYRQIWQREKLYVNHVPKTGNYFTVEIQVLPDEKIKEILQAYKERRILPKDFLTKIAVEPPTLDLIIYEQRMGELTTNAQAILALVKQKCSEYLPENYGPDNLADARKDRAGLNAAAENLNKERLRLEREFMKPFLPFKETVAETVKEIAKASEMLGKIIKAEEEKEKDAKRKLIEAYWKSTEYTLIPLEKIFKPEWLNKGSKMKDIETEIQAKIKEITEALAVLDRLEEPEVKALYLTTLSMDQAMKKSDELKRSKELLAQAATAPKAPEPAQDLEDHEPVRFNFPTAGADSRPPEPKEEEFLIRTFRVKATKAQLIALATYLESQGISFEKIDA